METPVQTAERLLAALEDLAAQEANLLGTSDYLEAVGIQARSAPLVDRLGELSRHAEVAALKSRVGSLLDRREQNRQLQGAQLARLQLELRRVDEANVRLAGLAPAYSTRPAAAAPRFNSAA
jgi:hypothetical protein